MEETTVKYIARYSLPYVGVWESSTTYSSKINAWHDIENRMIENRRKDKTETLPCVPQDCVYEVWVQDKYGEKYERTENYFGKNIN